MLLVIIVLIVYFKINKLIKALEKETEELETKIKSDQFTLYLSKDHINMYTLGFYTGQKQKISKILKELKRIRILKN